MESAAENSGDVSFLGLVFLVCMVALMWSLQRRFALIPLMITTCYMPLGQMFVVGGLHFQFFRILLLVSWCRVWLRHEAGGLRVSSLDKIFIWWLLVTLVLGSFTQPSVFSERFLNRCGEVFNAAGTYFLVRCWILNPDELIDLVRVMAWVIVPLALSMIVEKFTSRNVFSVFGGVPEITFARDGKLRCQGAFRHPILAGTYGATLFPLFVGLWFQRGRSKRPAIIGACSAVIVTIAAASSGAVLALMGEVVAMGLWSMRFHMRRIRWVAVLLLVMLAIVMSAPVWYVFAKLSEIAGGEGWYRSYLIDMAVNHFGQWWLVGTTYTANWAPGGEVVAANPGNMDILNQYVAEGLAGGIVKLLLFVAMIVICFKTIGRFTRRQDSLPASHRRFFWSLGVCLFGHCLSFFSVVYFDQIVVMWYWLLASISMLALWGATPSQDSAAAASGIEANPRSLSKNLHDEFA